MPRDNPTTSGVPKRKLSLTEVLADMEAAQSAPIELGDLPPLYAPEEIRRTQRTLPLPDMGSLAKLWLLIGEGNTGKTLMARYLIEKLTEHGKIDDVLIAALAPGNRNLSQFAPGTLQPPSADPATTATWATKRLLAMRRMRLGGVWDFGGGDTSLRMMIEAERDIAERSEQEGIALIPAYLFSPRLDDLAFLRAFERIGFRPRATALILNLGKADTPAAFNDIRRQPEYKAALDRGAVELWLPSLRQDIALAIEKARVFFAQARTAEITMIEQAMVGEWLMRVEAELAEVEKCGWMPWT